MSSSSESSLDALSSFTMGSATVVFDKGKTLASLSKLSMKEEELISKILFPEWHDLKSLWHKISAVQAKRLKVFLLHLLISNTLIILRQARNQLMIFLS
jgi:hypothetical protein